MLYRGKRVRERGRLPKGKFPKKGGRRLVSGLLALVLCLTLVPVIYADTVVTVTSWYAAGAFEENTLYWVDNNNEDGVRPGANTYQPSLWFRIDNGEWIELKGGEDSTLSGVGLSYAENDGGRQREQHLYGLRPDRRVAGSDRNHNIRWLRRGDLNRIPCRVDHGTVRRG